jgi:hypothetical protein
MVWKLPPYCTRFSVSHQNSDLSSACNRLFGARFSAATVQLCRRLAFLGLGFLSATKTQVVCRLLVIAFLGPGFRPPRFNFVIDSPFWGQVFGHHGSTLSSTRLAFLGPGFRPPRLNFVIDSPFWGQVFGHHGSTLSSTRLFGASFFFSHQNSGGLSSACNRLFGARFSAATVQLLSSTRCLPSWGECRIAEVSIPPQPTAFDC